MVKNEIELVFMKRYLCISTAFSRKS